MFNSSPPTLAPRHLRRRLQHYAWDHSYMYESSVSPVSSSLEGLSRSSSSPTRDLPARVSALNRRAAIVSANLAHLTAVVKPLETVKLEELSDGHVSDMWHEGMALGTAMEEFGEQMDEVSAILEELLATRMREKRVAEFVVESRGGGKGSRRNRTPGL